MGQCRRPRLACFFLDALEQAEREGRVTYTDHSSVSVPDSGHHPLFIAAKRGPIAPPRIFNNLNDFLEAMRNEREDH